MAQEKTIETVFKLVHALKRQIHKHIETQQLGIAPMHVRVLKIIEHHPGCTAHDISLILERDKAQVTRLLSCLINQGLITKTQNPADKRSQFLAFTDKGKEIITKVSAVDNQITQILSKDLSEKEITTFISLAERISENLDNE